MVRTAGIMLITSFNFMIQASMPIFQDSNVLYDNSSTQTDSTLSPVKLYEEPGVSKEPILGTSLISNDEMFLDMPFLPIISLRKMALQQRIMLDQLKLIQNTEEQQIWIQNQLQSISAIAHSTKVLFPGYFAALPIIPYSIENQSPKFFPTILVKERPETPFWPGWVTRRDINMQPAILNKKRKPISAAMLGAHPNLHNCTSWKPTKTLQSDIESKEER